VALNKADVLHLKNAIDEYELKGAVLDYVIFRDDMPNGVKVNGESVSGTLTLKQDNGSCVFLKDRLCTIHKHRPLPCRLYPFNPIFIERKDGYILKIECDNKCAGVGEGRRIDDNELRKQCEQWREERLEYEDYVKKWNRRKKRNLIDFVKRLIK
jgi:Fe-S-cluster containining protein